MSEQSSVCLENPAMFFIVSWCGSGRQVRNKIQPPERTHHTQSRPAQSRRAGWCSTFIGSVEHNCRSNSRGPWFCGKPTDIGPKSIAYSQHVTTRGWPCCRNIFQWEPWISNGFHPGHFIMMIFQSSSFPIGWRQVLQLYQLAPQRKHAEKSDEMWWVRVAAAYLCGYFCTQMFQEPMFLVKFLKQSLPRFIINFPHMILSSHVFFRGCLRQGVVACMPKLSATRTDCYNLKRPHRKYCMLGSIWVGLKRGYPKIPGLSPCHIPIWIAF